MSTALDKGYLRGREYLRRCQIETVTFEQYKRLGRVDVTRQYKLKSKQDEYLLGWWHAGEQFASLFKPDDNDTYAAEKRIKSWQQRLGAIFSEMEDLQDWQKDENVLQSHLWEAYSAVGLSLEMLDLAKERIESERAR